jgi:ribonuclease P protein component
MLPKNKRVTKDTFKNLKGSKSFSFPSATLKAMYGSGLTKVSFVVSKKIAKTAVLRNSLRRKGYSAVEKLYPEIKKGFTLIFFVKKEMRDVSFQELVSELKNNLSGAGIIQN